MTPAIAPSKRVPAVTEGQPDSARAAGAHEWAYLACLVVVGACIAASPVLEAVSIELAYDRIFDALAIVLLGLRVSEYRRHPLPGAGSFWFAAIVVAFFTAVYFNRQAGAGFHWQLVLLEGKFLLFLSCVWAFSNRVFSGRKIRRRALSVVWWGCVAGTALFFVVGEDGARLALVDESNYMVVGFIIVAVCYLDAHRASILSRRGLLVSGFLVFACALAQSRTGFATVGVAIVLMQMRERRYVLFAVTAYAILMMSLVYGEELLEIVTRGQLDISEIDRLIFVREYVMWAATTPPAEVFFGNHIGNFVLERPRLMTYWSARQSSEHGIPFGLAPFNFHTVYLRMLTAWGIVPTLGLLAYIVFLLRNSVDRIVLLVLALAGISMSIFYLSSTLPLVLLCQLAGPGRTRSGAEASGLAGSGVGKPALAGRSGGPGPMLGEGDGRAFRA